MPVEWFAVPSGSKEMVRRVPERLADHPGRACTAEAELGERATRGLHFLDGDAGHGDVEHEPRRVSLDHGHWYGDARQCRRGGGIMSDKPPGDGDWALRVARAAWLPEWAVRTCDATR